ncbi:MAG: N-formylglutamate deformylase [Marinicaulis sp.]|nr:N-formylglutamate deformylase [Marinicaulis sp.]NNL89056.1 N-formylglutamate deformylase [Marinicaulis sp.]
MEPVDISRGDAPLILAVPHAGLFVPDRIAAQLNETGCQLGDADWYVDRLYDGLVDNVTTVRANFHRYVIDANRDPSGASLYPGQNTTGLCPLTDFHGGDIYKNGCAPAASEIKARRLAFHAPYHEALTAEIERIRAKHSAAIVYDCHSIRSEIPYLFDGALPDFNIGTFNGQSCDRRIEDAVAEICAGADNYSSVVNGRFKGGWTTRHYGKPIDGVHAIQMELAQKTYLRECTEPDWDEAKAKALRSVLKEILTALVELAPDMKA